MTTTKKPINDSLLSSLSRRDLFRYGLGAAAAGVLWPSLRGVFADEPATARLIIPLVGGSF